MNMNMIILCGGNVISFSGVCGSGNLSVNVNVMLLFSMVGGNVSL